MSEHDPTRLLLLGDLDKTLGLAAEMVRGSPSGIAVGTPDSIAFDSLREAVGDFAVVDIAVNLHDVISRLRGERAGSPAITVAVEELVGHSVEDVERALILQTLIRCGGNRTTAAAMLGISVRTIRNKLRSFTSEGAVQPVAALRHHSVFEATRIS